MESLYLPNSHSLYAVFEVIGILAFLLIAFNVLYPRGMFLMVLSTKIEFSSKMKTAYNALKILSHSMKNQFITIKLLTDHYRKVQAGAQDDATLSTIQSICAGSIERLSNLAGRLGPANLNFEEIDLAQCLREYLAEIPRDDLTIHIHAAENGGTVFLDPFFFKNVIHNLILNAREAHASE